MEKQKITVMALSLVGIVGTFLPWVNAGPFSANGTEGGGDGYITLILYGIIILISLIGGLSNQFSMKSLIAVSVISLICSIIAIYDIGNVNEKSYGVAQVGVGLYVVLLMGLGVIGAGFGLRNKQNK